MALLGLIFGNALALNQIPDFSFSVMVPRRALARGQYVPVAQLCLLVDTCLLVTLHEDSNNERKGYMSKTLQRHSRCDGYYFQRLVLKSTLCFGVTTVLSNGNARAHTPPTAITTPTARKNKVSQRGGGHLCPSPWEVRQENCLKFEVSLDYIVNRKVKQSLPTQLSIRKSHNTAHPFLLLPPRYRTAHCSRKALNEKINNHLYDLA